MFIYYYRNPGETIRLIFLEMTVNEVIESCEDFMVIYGERDAQLTTDYYILFKLFSSF